MRPEYCQHSSCRHHLCAYDQGERHEHEVVRLQENTSEVKEEWARRQANDDDEHLLPGVRKDKAPCNDRG